MQKGKKREGNVRIRALLAIVSVGVLMTTWGVYYCVNASAPQQNSKTVPQCKNLEVSVKKISHSQKDIYTEKYQQEAEGQLTAFKQQREYSTVNPLLVENPYGTYSTSIYYYAKAAEDCYAKASIRVEGGSTLEHVLKNSNGISTRQEYNIIGLVPGKDNTVVMEFYNSKDELIEKTSFTYRPEKDKQIPAVLKTQHGESKKEMSDGLFAMFGHDKSKASNVYLFDNDGVARGRIPLNAYRTDRFLFADDQMIYSYDMNKIAFVNPLGKVEKTVDIGDYEFHHDFIYDEAHSSIIILANKKGADTIEDRVLVLDCQSGETKEVIDFERFMPEYRKSAVQRKGGKNTYGGTELDWIHFNSLDIIRDGEIILSSREHSSLIKVSDLYGRPKLDYIIHGGSLYKGTKYDKLCLNKLGDFVGQAGQHTITVEHDSNLPEGQYYLYMFNNNFGNAATIPSFDWSLYPGAGKFAKGDHSSYYKYLVDEEKRTYQLVSDIHLPYSSIVSSVNHMGGNISFSSGMSKCFGEYDTEGKMLRTFYYDADKYSYRVMKYDFKGFLYE